MLQRRLLLLQVAVFLFQVFRIQASPLRQWRVCRCSGKVQCRQCSAGVQCSAVCSAVAKWHAVACPPERGSSGRLFLPFSVTASLPSLLAACIHFATTPPLPARQSCHHCHVTTALPVILPSRFLSSYRERVAYACEHIHTCR